MLPTVRSKLEARFFALPAEKNSLGDNSLSVSRVILPFPSYVPKRQSSKMEFEVPLSPDDQKFLRQCKAASRESHDPHRQVGVVIVSQSGHLLATGTNKPPLAMNLRLQDSHKAITEDPAWKYFMLEHAERNAIVNARQLGHVLDHSTMYGTLFPCADCARAIVAAGIARLVVPSPKNNSPRDVKWQAHYSYAVQIFKLAGVQIVYANPDEVGASDTEVHDAGS